MSIKKVQKSSKQSIKHFLTRKVLKFEELRFFKNTIIIKASGDQLKLWQNSK